MLQKQSEMTKFKEIEAIDPNQTLGTVPSNTLQGVGDLDKLVSMVTMSSTPPLQGDTKMVL